MKKRKDGRYMAQRTIDGQKMTFYGDTQAEVYRKIDEYTKRKSKPATFREIAEAWQDAKWDSFAPGTLNCYRSAYERAVDAFGDIAADEVTAGMIMRLLDSMIAKRYSGKSVKTQKTVISTIYRNAIIEGKVTSNPAVNCVIPRGLPKKTREPPTEEEIRRVIESDDEWLFPKVLVYTGMRRGEALALCYEDFDFDRKIIHVNKEVIYRSNSPILVQRTKTSSGIRDVFLPDALAELIPRNKKGSMFESTLRSFKTQWDKYCERLGVDFTPHQLRHAYASFLYDAGVGVKEAQKLLGHADAATTQNVYTHIMQSRDLETANTLNDYFSRKSDCQKDCQKSRKLNKH